KAAGKVPWGYRIRRVGKGTAYIEKNPDAPNVERIVTRMFELARDGEGYGGIGTMLTADGILSPSGKAWSPDGVKSVLQNETYRGWVVFGKTGRRYVKGTRQIYRHLESKWDRREQADLRMVSDELWNAAHTRLA